ncbi:hypothetical protein N7468_003967 [Penicillium chermesinum]|uniref:Sulfatase N-terminal domain-containing protein n=1 Tax=Penicillium chermesinum TaxID=63820 RepID=A0A9W9TSR3_9EURO|nr:uncharacterized protein N7468_003967 [Penicillium chermesinum]KAJ5239348.1 hypothetical protein N7468_003967 [Penicillium chermesinum]
MKSSVIIAGLLSAPAFASVQHVLQSVLRTSQSAKPPNIVFVITDDQDLQLDSVSYTPLIQRHLQEKGVSFRNHFVTTALCCPSRVSLWTGRQAHNTNVTDVHPPYDPYTYSYQNATYQRNQDPPVSYEGQHTVDVITEKALGFLEDALTGERPFFVGVAPIAPHSNVDPGALGQSGLVMSAPIPLDRHRNFVSWIRDLPKQNQSQIDYNDFFYRSRLQALQGVDELVDALVTRLEESDQLDNTYIIYTSDNGFHIGQHRLPPGKTCGFEEDIRVPLFIRGPGIQAGVEENSVTTHIDLAPTIFQLAGIQPREDFDGTAIPLTPQSKATRHEHVTVEYRGKGVAEGTFSQIGATCIRPWEVLHPAEQVSSLRDALDDQHDLFYHDLPRVSFDWCDDGYLIEAEGPQLTQNHYGGSWDIWV